MWQNTKSKERNNSVTGPYFADIDTNGDEFLSSEELVAAFGDAGATLLKLDTDGDGILSMAEAQAAQNDNSDDDDNGDADDGDNE